jgi:alpha/beta superfamily hydrolase
METPVSIDLGAISLEGRLALPANQTLGGVVICHPHPLYGGEMDNPVVTRASEVCQAAGLAALRFNFRGVGGSGGVHDNGEGELDDVTSALDFLQSRIGPHLPLGVVGYSFGAWVGSRVAHRERRVRALAVIAPPLAFYDFGFLAGSSQAILLVVGSNDQYCPRDELQALGRRVPGARVAVIEGADHFFFGKLYPLGEAVAGWAREWPPSLRKPGDTARNAGSG